MRYTITTQVINVIGKLWMPNCTAAMRYTLSPYDMGNLGDPRNRADVERWIALNSGDFSQVLDFRADFTIDDESVIHDWKSEDSDMIYCDCMYPQDDDV